MSNKDLNLNTNALNTWCPGCSNFIILSAFKKVINSLVKQGMLKENFVLVSGIGCSSKIIDYINLNSFSSLHGRPVVSAQGIKLGNPKLNVIVLAGDGGIYNEGISHLVHAAKRNANITVLVHDNRSFALTTSQFTATSPKGFIGGSSPEGSNEKPFNPLEIMLASGATFIARGYTSKMDHLQGLIERAIKHKGFSFVEILQPCITFFDKTKEYNERVYLMKEKDLTSETEASKKIKEWDYNSEKAKISLGVFYHNKRIVHKK